MSRHQRRIERGALALLLGVVATAACGRGGRAADPAPLPVVVPEEPASEVPAADLVVPEDSTAELAALEALQELEFGSLAKGAGHVRGVLPVPDLEQIRRASDALDLFAASRGGAASSASPAYDIDVASFATQTRVQYYMDYFQGVSRDRFTIWLGRLNRYEGLIRSRFRHFGVPEDLVYLGLIESGYSNTAVSRARAVGMWQFMTATGRRYGLEVNDWVDERRDPFKATDAAARHLLDLKSSFGSWYLAAAAYNGGAGRVTRGIRRLSGVIENSDETFFALSERRYLRSETRDYVPKLIAAALIAKEPKRYGFDGLSYLDPLVFDEITIPDQTGLDVIARLADTTTAAIAELNPHFFRGVTAPGKSSIARVPRGSALKVLQRYAEVPPGDRVTFLEHVVRRGETLSGIAERYRVGVSLLRAANPRVHPLRLKIGARLTIPISSAARRSPTRVAARPRPATVPAAPAPAPAPAVGTTAPESPAGSSSGAAPAGSVEHHVVARGETLWMISQRYGVRVADLRVWNGIELGGIIRVGQRLRVAPPADAESR